MENQKINEDDKKELELFILKSLIKSPIIFISVRDFLKPSHFDNKVFGELYLLLLNAYTTYNKLLSTKEIRLEIAQKVKDQELRLELKNLIKMFEEDQTVSDEFFSIPYVENFVKNKLVSGIIYDLVNDVKINDDNINYSKYTERVNNIRFKINKSMVFKASDFNYIWEKNPLLKGNAGVVKSNLKSLNRCLTYGGYLKGTVNSIVMCPKGGKSTFLISETGHAVNNQKNVFYCFLGDVKDWEGWLRIVTRLIGGEYDKDAIVHKNRESVESLVNSSPDSRFDRVRIVTYPSGELTPEDLYENIMRSMDKFDLKMDMVVIDYLDNLRYGSDSLYERGSKNISSLERIANATDVVVLTASQPKQPLWNDEYIMASNASAESSKKEAMLDLNLVCGKPLNIGDGKAIGALNITQNRYGEGQKLIHLLFNYKKSTVDEISLSDYKAMKDFCRELKENGVES